MKNILVVFGGNSCESDVSVITGVMTANSLSRRDFNPVPLYFCRDGYFYTGEKLLDLDFYKRWDTSTLKKAVFVAGDKYLYSVTKGKIKPLIKIDAVLNCCHGGLGEGGSLSGFFETLGFFLCSPSITASGVALDKFQTKTYFKGTGILTAKALLFTAFDDLNKLEKQAKKEFGYPMIVKPATLGSSIGIKVVKDFSELERAVNFALRFDNRVVIEEFLQGAIELNCAAYLGKSGITVSECERPLLKDEMLSFDDKYVSGKRIFPADIEEYLSDQIKQTTKKAYTLLDMTGVVRIDYLYYRGKLYLNEINSVPGSLSLYLFADNPEDYQKVLADIIAGAEKRRNLSASLISSFESGILSGGFLKGGKRLKVKNDKNKKIEG